jgi:serine/threonine protein kinase
MDAGSELAGYRIESVIGRGGMGVVYLAEHLRLKRKVAFKVLAPELAQDERFRERFIHESELAASLEHPSIVPIYDAGEAEGLLYIAMRFIEGTDLKSRIETDGALDPPLAAGIIEQVASALDAAHEKGLVHRDVKPANILLDRGSRAYLTDFGLTKRPDQATGLTKTGQFLGTVDYAAPEQFEDKPLHGRTDVYSLGCVAFECLTGRVPFVRDREAAVMYAHLNDAPPAPSAARPELGPAVDAAIRKAMAKSPDERHNSAGDFAKDLSRALRSEEAVTASGTAPARSLWARTPAVAAGVLIIAAAITLAALLSRDGKKADPRSHISPSAGTSTGPLIPGSGANLRIDPDTNAVVAKSGSVGFVATGGGFVWVSGFSDIEKINPQNDKVIATIDLVANDLAFGDGFLWATAGVIVRPANSSATDVEISRDSLYRIDPRTNSKTRLAALPDRDVELDTTNYRHAMAIGEGSVWVVLRTPEGKGFLLRYDQRDGHLQDRLPLKEAPHGVAFGQGSVWIRSNGLIPSIVRVDPDTRQQDSIDVGGADGIAFGADAVWVSDATDNIVLKIDPNTNTHAGQIAEGISDPRVIAAGPHGVWVFDVADCAVVRIDPATNRVAARVPVGGQNGVGWSLVDGDEGVWVGGGLLSDTGGVGSCTQ